MISFWKLVITYISRLSGRKTISFISLFKILIIYIHIQIWFYPLPDTPSLLKVTAWQIARSIKTSSQNTQTFHTGKDKFFPTLKKEYAIIFNIFFASFHPFFSDREQAITMRWRSIMLERWEINGTILWMLTKYLSLIIIKTYFNILYLNTQYLSCWGG